MAKAIGGMKESIEYDIFCFSDRIAEKAYYNDLLEHGGIIEGEGKYEFLGKKETDKPQM